MQTHTTPVPNIVFDKHLRELKGTELKMFLVIIRQTLGWKNKENKKGRKERDWISSSQLKTKTGCSQRSITSATEILVMKNLIEVFSEEGELLDAPEKRKGKKRMYYRLPDFVFGAVDHEGKTSLHPNSYPQTSAKLAEPSPQFLPITK